MIGWILFLVAVPWAASATYVAVRAVRRLFQFDEICGEAIELLLSYGGDLEDMSSRGILEGHPEVRAFHKRNRQAVFEIAQAVERLSQVRGLGVPKKSLGKPPVVR